jgi:hypothetical protein
MLIDGIARNTYERSRAEKHLRTTGEEQEGTVKEQVGTAEQDIASENGGTVETGQQGADADADANADAEATADIGMSEVAKGKRKREDTPEPVEQVQRAKSVQQIRCSLYLTSD